MPTQVQIRYFASLREALGAGETLSVDADATVAAVRDLLRARSPAHAQALARERAVRCALNQSMCEEAAAVRNGDELAFFPPVTGG